MDLDQTPSTTGRAQKKRRTCLGDILNVSFKAVKEEDEEVAEEKVHKKILNFSDSEDDEEKKACLDVSISTPHKKRVTYADDDSVFHDYKENRGIKYSTPVQRGEISLEKCMFKDSGLRDSSTPVMPKGRHPGGETRNVRFQESTSPLDLTAISSLDASSVGDNIRYVGESLQDTQRSADWLVQRSKNLSDKVLSWTGARTVQCRIRHCTSAQTTSPL